MSKDMRKKSWLYAAVLVVYRWVFRLLYGGRIIGQQKIPDKGPVVLMCNHIHGLDPFTLASCAPKRQAHYMAKVELFKNKLLAAILRTLHAFPVGRGQFDLTAMREARTVLDQDQVLGIFPEGHRFTDGQLGPLQSGAAVLALKCDAVVIPVAIEGTYKLFGKPQVIVGDPIQMDDLREQGANKETCDVCIDRMRGAIQGLLNESKQLRLPAPTRV